MTTLGLDYLKNLETRRHNLAMEQETERANQAKEAENLRSNLRGEALKAAELLEKERANKKNEELTETKQYLDKIESRLNSFQSAVQGFQHAEYGERDVMITTTCDQYRQYLNSLSDEDLGRYIGTVFDESTLREQIMSYSDQYNRLSASIRTVQNSMGHGNDLVSKQSKLARLDELEEERDFYASMVKSTEMLLEQSKNRDLTVSNLVTNLRNQLKAAADVKGAVDVAGGILDRVESAAGTIVKAATAAGKGK